MGATNNRRLPLVGRGIMSHQQTSFLYYGCGGATTRSISSMSHESQMSARCPHGPSVVMSVKYSQAGSKLSFQDPNRLRSHVCCHYGATIALVTSVPPVLPAHSAASKASSICSKGKAWDMTRVRGYLSRVRVSMLTVTGRMYGS